ncbi:MAG: hypothetical protein QXZ44_02360 [Ferroplasma sp.]
MDKGKNINEMELINKMNRGLVYLAIAISIIVFFYSLPFTFSEMPAITKISSSYIYLNISLSSGMAYFLLIFSMIIVFASFIPLVYSNDQFTGMSRNGNAFYYSIFSIYMAIMIFLSAVIEIFDPAITVNPLSKMGIGIQNFVYLSEAIIQIGLFVIIPLIIMTAIYLAITKNLTLKNMLKPGEKIKRAMVGMIVITGIIAVFATNYGFYDTILLYISTLLLAFIYLKYGMLRAILVSFISSTIDFASILFSSSIALSLAMSIFLFIWAFAGLYTVTFFYVEKKRKQNEESEKQPQSENNEVGNSQEKKYGNPARNMNPDELWVRSACANCGNVEYRVNPDLSLVCTNCGQEYSRDSSGPFNIVIDKITLHRNS